MQPGVRNEDPQNIANRKCTIAFQLLTLGANLLKYISLLDLFSFGHPYIVGVIHYSFLVVMFMKPLVSCLFNSIFIVKCVQGLVQIYRPFSLVFQLHGLQFFHL